jgi:diguanylate cyclase (GGDEF)-like protein
VNRFDRTRATADGIGLDARATGRAATSRRILLSVIGVLGFMVLSVVYLGSATLPLDPLVSLVVRDLAFTLTIGVTIVTGWIAFRRSSGAEARFWLLLSCANAVILASELYYLWWLLSAGTPPPPVYAPFQVMHLVAAALFLTLVLSMTKFQNATVTQRVRYLLDLVATVTVAYVAVLILVVDPLFRPLSGVMPIDRVAGAAYPIWGLLVVGGTLSMLLGFKVSRWRAWEKFVALSLVIYSLGIAAWPLWYVSFKTEGATLERGFLDLVLLLGHYLLTIATIYRVTGGGQQWPLRPTPLFQPTPRGRLSYVVPALTLFSMPFFVYLAVRADADPLERTVFTVAASVLAAVTVSRTALVAVENGRLLHRSVTDPLTGLFNHRFFHERLGVEIDVATRYGETLALLVMDLDDFDIVNNLHGHPAGDDLLRRVATAIRSACRDSDPVCRIGGDEFAVILPGVPCSEALTVALRIREGLRAVESFDDRPVTLSAGIACVPTHSTEATELARLADGAAYWAKHHGKDQTLVYDPDVVADLNSDERIRTLETQTHLGTVRALAAAVDARDADTQYHSRNVAAMATQVARALGLDEDRCALLETAGLMHDVGKIGVPDDILRKAGPLDADERATVHGHAELGERILTSTAMDAVLPWIRHHHERWDGEGYPDGLRAVTIPLEARILSVCDAWDAMTSDRPYRSALTKREAAAELAANMGTQFDPAVVEVFLRTVGAAAPDDGAGS